MSLRLSSHAHKVVLALHIAVSAGVLGADLALLALGLGAMGGVDSRAIFPAAELIGQRVVLPLALASLASGVALALTTPWGLFRHAWVTTKLAITAMLSVAVVFVLLPGLEAAADAAAAGTLDQNPLLIGPVAAASLLVTALLLAVFKPGRRFRGESA